MPAIVMVWLKGIAQSIPNGIMGLEIWWFSIFGSWERWVDGLMAATTLRLAEILFVVRLGTLPVFLVLFFLSFVFWFGGTIEQIN
jgi:hypothetical protein